MLRLSVVFVLLAVSISEASSAPEKIIQAYFNSINAGDYRSVQYLDYKFYKITKDSADKAPLPLKNEEVTNALKSSENFIADKIRKNLNGQSNIDEDRLVIGETAYNQLFNIIYPNCKYSVLEVRDIDDYSYEGIALNKLAYLEVEYSDKHNSPYDGTHKKLKRAIYEVVLSSDKIVGNRLTEYKKEYF